MPPKILVELQTRLEALKKQEQQEQKQAEHDSFLINLEKARLCAHLAKHNKDEKQQSDLQTAAKKYYDNATKTLPRKLPVSKTLQIKLFVTQLILNEAKVTKITFEKDQLNALAKIDQSSPGLIAFSIVQHLKFVSIKNKKTQDILAGDAKNGFTELNKAPLADDVAALDLAYKKIVSCSFQNPQKPAFLYIKSELITIEGYIVRDFINRNVKLLGDDNEKLEVRKRLTIFEWNAWTNDWRGATDRVKCTALDCLSIKLKELNTKQTRADLKQGLGVFFKDFLLGKVKDVKGQIVKIDIIKLIEHNDSGLTRAISSLFTTKQHSATNSFAAFINVFLEAEVNLGDLFNEAKNAADNTRKPQITKLQDEYELYKRQIVSITNTATSTNKLSLRS